VQGKLEGELAMRFQQLTGPVMAKGYEDTVLYRYNRLVALNEVGGDPSCFGISLQYFHEACMAARPLSLLASTTHDTKRSEDCRARLAVLSEIPEHWGSTVKQWLDRKGFVDRNLAYLFFQTLVGAWPIDQQRIQAYVEKAMHEAKEYTSWTKENKEYEKSVLEFVKNVMEDPVFLAEVEQFVAQIIHPGRINSLAQTLIKLTSPGIPDIYQGSELWNLSLVDPDNRREVDFALRRRLLKEMQQLSVEQILTRMDEGLPKLWLIRQTLQLRKSQPKLFEADYKPLYAEGKKAKHVVAFLRGEKLLSVIPRFSLLLHGEWSDTQLKIPDGLWRNVLTGDEVQGGAIFLKDVFQRFPVALLIRSGINL
jgi:(1->4)-alpha-D-glucan 1-alpha-D-glucosylmutase